MEILHSRMLREYYTIIKNHYDSSSVMGETLMSPTTDIIKELSERLHKVILEEAEKSAQGEIALILDADQEDDELAKDDVENVIEKEIMLLQIDIIKAVLIYILAIPHERDAQLLSYIHENSITTILEKLNTDSRFEELILIFYVRYLVCKSEGLISSYVESKTQNENKIIWNIAYNKGMNSIADLAKQAFIELYEDLVDTHGYCEKVWSVLDKFINENTCLVYFEQNEIDTSNLSYLKMVKHY